MTVSTTDITYIWNKIISKSKSRHGDDSLTRVYLCLWPLGHHLSWGTAVAALHRHLRLATPNWAWRPPWCIYLLPEVLLDHSIFARSPNKCTDFSLSAPCMLCSLQAKHRGVFLQGPGRLSCPWSWSFMTEVCDASSLSSFMMFLPSSIPASIPASRRKSSI